MEVWKTRLVIRVVLMSFSEGPVNEQVRVLLRVLLVLDHQVPHYLGPPLVGSDVYWQIVLVGSWEEGVCIVKSEYLVRQMLPSQKRGHNR